MENLATPQPTEKIAWQKHIATVARTEEKLKTLYRQKSIF
jgi:hypothetical protein